MYRFTNLNVPRPSMTMTPRMAWRGTRGTARGTAVSSGGVGAHGGSRGRRRSPPQDTDGTRDGTRGTLHAILGVVDGQDGRGTFRFVNLYIQEPEFTFLNADSHIRKNISKKTIGALYAAKDI